MDNLSLMALTIATGFVVDDAIVVIENITRYLEQGMAPMQAALRGAKEIGFTVLSISISLVAVFIPILMMGGIVGRLFREFAVTLSVAILISLVVSLTTTPMMCAKLLRNPEREKHGRIYRLNEWTFNKIHRGYEISLRWVLRHQPLMLLVTLSTIALTIYLYVIIPKGFFPQQDTGRLSGQIMADQATSFQAMRERLLQMVNVVIHDPAVDSLNAYTGGSGGFSRGINTGTMYIMLKSPKERNNLTADQVIARLRAQTARIPGATLFLQPVQDLRIGGRGSAAQYQFTLQSDSVQDLNHWAPIVQSKLRALPRSSISIRTSKTRDCKLRW